MFKLVASEFDKLYVVLLFGSFFFWTIRSMSNFFWKYLRSQIVMSRYSDPYVPLV
jgi:hypothetical protein